MYKLTGYIGDKEKFESAFSADVAQLDKNICGKNFVLTGFGAKDEKKITDEIISRGGVIKSSVSTKTNFLIFFSGYGQETSKLSKAKELNAGSKSITILNEKQLTEFLGGIVQTQEVPVDNSADVESELAKSGFVVKNGALKKYTGNETEVVVPDIVTSVTKNAFARNDKIKKVIFSKNLKRIGENVFEFCSELVEVIFEEGLTSIGTCAFYGCRKLKNIVLPESLNKIGGAAFRGTGIEFINIPDNVTVLDNYTFAECPDLKKVKMSKDIYMLYYGVFNGCSKLREIELPSALIEIGDECFSGCESLEKVVFAKGARFSYGADEYDDEEKCLFFGCNNLVIYTNKNSCADKYAKIANIKVEYI